MQKATSFDDVAIFSVKRNYYRINFLYFTKHEVINLMKTSDFWKSVNICGNIKHFFVIVKLSNNNNTYYEIKKEGLQEKARDQGSEDKAK